MAKNGKGQLLMGIAGGAILMYFGKPMLDDFLGNMQNNSAYARAQRAYARARLARYY